MDLSQLSDASMETPFSLPVSKASLECRILWWRDSFTTLDLVNSWERDSSLADLFLPMGLKKHHLKALVLRL